MIFRAAITSIFTVSAALALAATPSTQPVLISGPTMGTTYRVKLVDATKANAAALRPTIADELADIDRRLSTYRADSEISRFNRAGQGEWFPVSPATAQLVVEAKELSRKTNGALDVTVGPLVRLWHFGPDSLRDVKSMSQIKPPSGAVIQSALERIGDQHLSVRTDPAALRKDIAGLEIDLSAVGEGYAIDRLADIIENAGISHFLIELGGEVRASGHGPQGKPWRVAITRPADDRSEMQVAIPLVTTPYVDAALSTSGDYHRYFEHNGRRYSHIIDPATGRPIAHHLASVTVAAENAITTDAWDTALLVLGPDRGYECAVHNNIAALFIERSGDGFVVRETPAWQEKFSLSAAPAVKE